MKAKFGRPLRFAVLSVTVAAGLFGGEAMAVRERPYTVWMTDQNNTAGFSTTAPRGTHGGSLVIHNSAALEAAGGPRNEAEVIDLAQLYAIGGPNNPTGANVVRPHMLQVSPDGKFVALAFVASGHVAILDAKTKAPINLFRMTPGAGGAIQAHAAIWTQRGNTLIVANQNGKLVERISYDKQSNTFTHDTAATLNLVTCVTPGGKPCQTPTPVNDSDPNYLGPDNRPDNAPICPVNTQMGHSVITLRGGGMFVVDPSVTPMAIVAAYGNQTVGRDGCGGQQVGKKLFINGGTGNLVTNPHEFTLYQFEDRFPKAPFTLPDNDPSTAPQVIFKAGNELGNRDAHGMNVVGKKNYIWQFDRLANVVEVFDSATNAQVSTIQLVGPVSSDPTPDLAAASPDGSRMYVALRGPVPQTGAHAASGSTPGLGIVNVEGGGVGGRLSAVMPTSNINPINGAQESDPHGVTVVELTP